MKKNGAKKHIWKIHFPVSLMFLKKYFSANKILRRSVLVLTAFSLIFVLWFLNYSFSSIDRKNLTIDVEIPTGSSFLESTQILNKAGLVKNRFFFVCLATIRGAWRHIRAGEYEIHTQFTPWTMINKLVRGEIKQYKVSIPEDLSVREIAEILDQNKLINKETFFKLAQDREFLKSLKIDAESIEGYLFPETYFFNRSMNTRSIMKKMVDTFWEKVPSAMIEQANAKGFDLNQFITFASLIGKESGYKSEKSLIAAVFYNRMKKGMRLQSDPTAVYDLDHFEGKVLRSHLKRNSPYNTYLIKGLPPGPIANPGLDSFNAVLHPEAAHYLYFVSKKDGTHHFSSSLAEHNQAVNKYIYLKNEQIQQLKEDEQQIRSVESLGEKD
jgi:UPF0755 protein